MVPYHGADAPHTIATSYGLVTSPVSNNYTEVNHINRHHSNGSDDSPSSHYRHSHIPGELYERSVYVGNLSFDTTEQQVQEHFASCGLIDSVTLPPSATARSCRVSHCMMSSVVGCG